MNLNFKQLETFIRVADLGSFRRAAERLFTTQPNVSSRIASLENLLGVRLMERDAGSVRLTAKGEQLLPFAREVMKSMEGFVEAVDKDTLFDGVLRLGVTEMIAQSWLRDFLLLFKKRFTNIQLELTVDLAVNLEQELAEGSIDLAFQSGPCIHQVSGNLSLGQFPNIWVASPELVLSQDATLTVSDIAQYPILTHARHTQVYQQLNSYFAARPQMKVKIVPSSSLAVCHQMTVDGFGVAPLLAPVAEKSIAQGLLVKLDHEWVPEPLAFFARFDAEKSSNIVSKAAELAVDISNQLASSYAQN